MINEKLLLKHLDLTEVKLYQAIKKQLNLDDDELYLFIEDIARHGLEGGYHGFTYTSDIFVFHDKNKDVIWDFLYNQSEQYGSKDIGHFLIEATNIVYYSYDEFITKIVFLAVELIFSKISDIIDEQKKS